MAANRPLPIRIDLGYHGARFHGSQRQPGVRTVQSELEGALEQVTGVPRRIHFAGRTDRGVHAVGQVASGEVVWNKDLERLRHALDSLTGPDLAVYCVSAVNDGFHARFSAVRREYRYRIWNTGRAPVLARELVWWVRQPLDFGAMQAASDLLAGESDFRSFTGKGFGTGKHERRTVRRIEQAGWESLTPGLEPGGSLFEFRIVADSYLPHMVRNIVGALFEVGTGNREPEWIVELLNIRDRRAAPPPAPPEGLVLWNVDYEEDEQSSNAAGAGAP